ncbi:glucosamine--fructose-6-phosphate aminotransferase [Mesorhizobium sp. 113-1-2]|uniref:SIS domain-containing protein n=1 Tax=Mesorhizobium sp. 113-1-2 TaxID=2744515 RepID=UPI00192530C5|nr:SIS domain-containing protein [Mesorhizobium sp. 113-1-2]BCG75075.1 glucosamine--fructose-6-phosphate aminotransferase [Mesorhizobium sp. 113-1-2]
MQIGNYIRRQPATLAGLPAAISAELAGFASLRQTPERIVLLGTGSSMNALLAGAEALEEGTGASVIAKEPEAFLRLPPKASGQRTLVLAASQSGMSITTIEAVRLSVQLGFPTLVITGEAGSLITETGAEIIVMPIGPETVGPKTMGYTATVMSVLAVAAKLAGKTVDLSGLLAQLEQTAETGLVAAKDLVTRFGVPDYILVAGQATHLGTALETSLKIAEISGVPTAGFDTEEALHGHVYGTTNNSLVIAIAQTETEAKVAANLGEALAELGPRTVVLNLSGHPTRFDLDVSWPTAPSQQWLAGCWAPMPLQWYGCELAIARGIDPDKMIYPNLGKRLNVRIRKEA